MGMFDSIKVDADNICNIAVPKSEFQTYDMDNQCWVFRITKDGKLTVETKATDFGNDTGVNWFNSNLTNSSTILYDVANGKFGGVISMGGELEAGNQWADYLLLVHDGQIQFVTKYGEIVYTADPESNDVFWEVLDKACTPNPLSMKQEIMFQQMMSSKHLLASTPSRDMDSTSSAQKTEMVVFEEKGKLPLVLRNGYAVSIQGSHLTESNKLESRSASASLMTAEDAPKAMERELQARKDKLAKDIKNESKS